MDISGDDFRHWDTRQAGTGSFWVEVCTRLSPRRNPESHDQIKIHPWYFSSANWRISPVFGWLVWLEGRHTLSYPSEGRRCNLFLTDWRDEIQQADVPTPAEALIWAFQTDRRQFNLLRQWKSAVWFNAHLPVTKWNLIFPFEERLLTDPPLPVEAKHRTFLKLIEMFFFHFRTRIRWAWISIWFCSLLKDAAERYDKDVCEKVFCTFSFLLDSKPDCCSPFRPSAL